VSGRVRLGWRVLLFLVLAAVVTLVMVPWVPSDLPYGTAPLLIGCLVSGWTLLLLDGRGPGALGFYLGREVGRESLSGFGLGVAVAGLVVVGMVGLAGLRWTGEDGGAVGYFAEAGWSLWLFTIPAAGEEALMRGYLFQAIAEAWGGGIALWVTSAVFAVLHLGNPNTSWIGLANIMFAGLFLGLIYWRTASLWWATGAHLGWNWTLGFLADLPVSGLEVVDAPGIQASVRGPEWLSGGPFGPEGSLLASVVLGMAVLMLWSGSWLRPGRRARETRPLFLPGTMDAVPRTDEGHEQIGNSGERT
jgi:membrane protease YdiL (CAAX protease family)